MYDNLRLIVILAEWLICVCMCMCVYVCIHTRVCGYIYIHTYVHANIYIFVYHRCTKIGLIIRLAEWLSRVGLNIYRYTDRWIRGGGRQ